MSKLNEKKMIDEIRLLALDMIMEARSGHPGIALSAAPMLYTLYANHMIYDLDNPTWPNRDRFVLSAGHASALLYATMYATMETFTMDELKMFTHLNSPVPSHPVLNLERRIECTTGSLGQGFATAVGMAIAEKQLEEKYNTKKTDLFNYKIYCLCSDGDLMEGVSYEAANIAGELNLNNLIVLYDANKMTLDGALDKDYNDRIANVFASLDWNVLVVKNGEHVSEIDKAISAANRSKLPTLIIVNTVLGKHSLYENTNRIHSRLSKEDLEQMRDKFKGTGPFQIDEKNLYALRKEVKTRNQLAYSDWQKQYEKVLKELDERDANNLKDLLADEEIILDLDRVIDKEKLFLDKPMRDINFQVMNVISAFIDKFVGGSADLVNSTKAYLKNGGEFTSDDYQGKNLTFRVRENAMGAVINGLALSGFRPFSSTFLTFSDNMKPSIRNGAIMNLPVTYIFTHDSIRIGVDGVTHQPVEQLGLLRTIPNLEVYRPCDYKELIGAWQLILKEKKPAALVVAKNPTESYRFTSIEETALGGYVISEVKNRLDVILIASGSEVTLAMKLKQELLKSYIEARIVSMPNINAFLRQPKEYQNQVLPKGYKRMAIEFSNDPTIYHLIKSDDDIINVKSFGKNGHEEEILEALELDIPSLVIKIKNNI